MRSFSGPCEPSVSSPAREPAGYSAPEREQIQRDFAPQAAKYRRQKHVSLYCVLGMLSSILLMPLVPRYLSPWLLIPAAGCCLAAIVVGLRTPSLVCPACANDLEDSLGAYCPECGSGGLELGAWERSPNYTWFRESCCKACRRMLLRSSRLTQRRLYKIRACTHCGLILDARGL